MKTKFPECEKCSAQVAWIGMTVSAINAMLKFYFGFVGGSKGVIASAIHSTACIISNITIAISRSISKKDNDLRFTYGYGKVEFVSSVAVSSVILIVVSVFVVSAVRAILNHHYSVPHFSTFVVSVVSIVSNEIVFRFMNCVGQQYSSPALKAGAWANRSDGIASIAVLVGIIGTWMGIHNLDSLMGLVVAAILYIMIGKNLLDGVKGLMDYSSGDSLGNRLKILLKNFPEIREVVSIKTRPMGQYTKVDLFVRVPPEFTVSETDALEKRIAGLLRRKEPSIGDLVVGFEGQ